MGLSLIPAPEGEIHFSTGLLVRCLLEQGEYADMRRINGWRGGGRVESLQTPQFEVVFSVSSALPSGPYIAMP